MKFVKREARASALTGAAWRNKGRRAHLATGAIPADLRRYNRGLILELFSRHGSMSRAQIAGETRLTGAAVSRISRGLIDAGLLVERTDDEMPARLGRPTVTLDLAANGGFVIGVAIGAFEQWVQIANLRGDCICRGALELLGKRTPGRALAMLARNIRALVRESGVPPARIFGVGVAVAGVVDHQQGIVLHSPNIGWKDVHIAQSLSQALRLPTQVESLHHALNIAESRLASTRDVVVLVNAAMGIGASVMEEGRIIRGSQGAAGQMGHMRVTGATELCTCGRRGCLDTVASGHAVLRRLGLLPLRRTPREHDPAAARRLLQTIEQERRGENRTIRAAFRACGERLGDALNGVHAMLDPSRIIIAGPLSQTGSYLEGVRAVFDHVHANEAHAASFLIHLATHSGDAAAARLALDSFVFSHALDMPARAT